MANFYTIFSNLMILISEWTDTGSVSSHSFHCTSSLPDQRYQALLTINQAIVNKRPSPVDTFRSRSLSLNTEEDAMSCSFNCSGITDGFSIASSSRSYQTDNKSWNSDQASMSDILTDLSLSGTQVLSFLICEFVSVNQKLGGGFFNSQHCNTMHAYLNVTIF